MGKRYKTSETTCQAISGALKQLMTQKPLERITVAEIMDTCGMRRQHFYYYFTDIYDLLRWTFEKEALELLQQQQGVSPLAERLSASVPIYQSESGGLPLRAGLSGQGIFETAAGGGCQQHRGPGRPADGGGKRPVGPLAGGGSGDLPGDHYDGRGGGKLAPGRVDPDTGGADPADRYDVSGLYSRCGPSAEGSCRCIRIENEEGVFL